MSSEMKSNPASAPWLRSESDGDALPRQEWFRRRRRDAHGRQPRGAFLRAATRRAQLDWNARRGRRPGGLDQPLPAPGVNWTPLGPSVISAGFAEVGRVSALSVGPGGTRVYAGAADGGVWISNNSGGSWAPLNDYYEASDAVPGDTPSEANSLSVGALAVAFGSSAAADEIFVGTGEANQGWPALDVDQDVLDNYFGVGICHYVSGACSLEATNLASQAIYRITIDPNDATPTNIYAATTAGLFKRPTGGGSLASWNQIQVNPTTIDLPVTDIIAAGAGSSRMFYAAVFGDNVYSSPDGSTWTALSGLGTLSTVPIYGRIALAGSASNPNVIYAIISNGNLFRLDTSMGSTFQQVQNLPGGVPFGGQGWYDIAIAVDPTLPNTIYLGGSGNALYKGDITVSGGVPSFPASGPTNVGAGIHADTHAICFALNSSGTAPDPTSVWVGCDGGVYQSGMSGAAGSFQSLNLGMAIPQVYSFGQRSDTDAVVYAGLQDNGGPRFLGEQAGLEVAEVGDGGSCVYHPTDPYRAMMQYKGTGLIGTADGGATWSANATFPVPPPYSSNQNSECSYTNFITPITAIADASAPGGAQFAFGTNRLWLSSDWGVTWVTLPSNTNPYSVTPPNLNQDVIESSGSTVQAGMSAIAFASPTQIYAATQQVIWRYDFSGGNWTNTVLPTSAFPSGFYITGIAVENASQGSIYVSLGGMEAGVPHVWYYDGSNWYAALPVSDLDVPTHTVVVDAKTGYVYAGTDVGCWQGVRTGTTWTWMPFNNGLPQCAILQLAIHENAYLLRAGTCGRGVWEIPLDSAAVGLDPDLYMRVDYADTGRLSGGSRFPWVEGAYDPINVGDKVYHWMSADIKVRRSSLSNLPAISSPATYLDFAFNIGDYAQPSTDIETADISGPDSIFVEVHNRSVVNAVPAANVRILLLVADASTALPALPSGWNSHVNSGDSNPSWLGAGGWQFVDAGSPYRTPNADVDVRMPQVVEYQFDFSTLNLPPGHDHVCLLAMVTTVDSSDQITSTGTDLNTVTMTDKHVVHRNLHLVALGAEPAIRTSGLMFLNFNNPHDEIGAFDISFERGNFPGQISLLLPKLSELAPGNTALSGFQLRMSETWVEEARQKVGDWIERLGRLVEGTGEKIAGEPAWMRPNRLVSATRRHNLERLDYGHVLRAEAGRETATIAGMRIPPRSGITGAFAIDMPPQAKPKDRYRLDVIQRSRGKILGGSSYVVAIV